MTKSRVLGLREGNDNTKFFLIEEITILVVSILMELTIDQEVIEEGIVWFYKSLYLEDELICPYLDVWNFFRISKDKGG